MWVCYLCCRWLTFWTITGILQMCLKEDDAVGFVPTGIMLEIQNDILGLEVNGLTPTRW